MEPQLSKQKLTGVLGLIGLFAVMFASSCTKDRYVYVGGNGSTYTGPVAFLTVIDASPDAGSLDFYLDNNLGGSGINYGGGLAYLNAYTGKRTASFFKRGTNTLVKQDTMTLNNQTYYSLYLANLAATPDFLKLKDTIAQPAANMASIRFVDVSTDAPSVDLGIKGGSIIATKRKYKGFSSFIPIKGDTTYTFEVRNTGTSTVIVSQSNVTIRKGSIYTVWLHGLMSATDNTRISVDIQRNAYY